MDRVDEAACVRTVDLAEDLTVLLDGRDVASGHRLDAEVEAVRMGELAEFGVVVRQAVDVGVVACAEHLSGAEAGAGFEEGLPVDGTSVGLDAENFDVEDLDAGAFRLASTSRIMGVLPIMSYCVSVGVAGTRRMPTWL